jgi:cytochrome P450
LTAARPLPPGPKGHWLTGHLPDFRRGSLEFITQVAREYGDFVPVRLGRRRLVLVSDPDAIEEVLVPHSRDFIKHFGLQLTRQLLGNGLLNSEGDFWLRQRRLAQPAFHRDRIRAYGQIMVGHALEMLDGWRDGQRRDLAAEMMALTMRIAAKTLFDADDPGEAEVIRQALAESSHLFNVRFASLIRFPLSWPTPRNLKMRRICDRLNAIIYRFIAERRAAGDTGKGDLLSLLLYARDVEGDGSGMTDRQLRDELMTLFLAGQETTALALSWSWYLLADHPAAFDRLAAELDEVLGGRAPTPDDYPRLKFAEAVVLESMRLYPPAALLGREAVRDLTIGGYRIPKGTTLFLCQWITHRDARWFDWPEEFVPERWLDGLAGRLHRYAYFPFGGGPRICIGNTFAMMEAVMVVAAVAQRYRFTRADGEPIAPLPSITLRLSRPLDVTLHQRAPIPVPLPVN